MEMNQGGRRIHQVLVKLLDGTHKFLNFTSPSITIQNLKHRIETLTSVPSHLQLLLLNQGGHLRPTLLHEEDIRTLNLFSSGSRGYGDFPAVVHLLVRLRGGKGGFGSLLRGSATKAGQKKTNNFDACRDMSGRRMRHVNAEKKFEEWKAEAGERKLEKMAEEYIKKMSKEMAKKGKGKGGGDVDKYVQKYREDSEKCREELERSVRESLKDALAPKRKGGSAEANVPESKRLKIWFGKRKLGDSDSENTDEDDSEEDEDEENNRSDVLDNGDQSDSSEAAKGSSDSVKKICHDMSSTSSGMSESVSDEEKAALKESLEPDESRVAHEKAASVTEAQLGVSDEHYIQHKDNLSLHKSIVGTGAVQEEKEASNESDHANMGEIQVLASSCVEEASVSGTSDSNGVVTDAEPMNSEKPLNFDEINSTAELEVLGLDRLKAELQARGLKCGGTLQERAARLFLLKTTPIEMLPKKYFAKK